MESIKSCAICFRHIEDKEAEDLYCSGCSHYICTKCDPDFNLLGLHWYDDHIKYGLEDEED